MTQVVGGSKVKANEFPHMAAIGQKLRESIRWFCGGSLISDNFVLTAAHCILKDVPKVKLVVRVGDVHLNDENDGAHPQEFGVKNVFVHPSYTKIRKYNDIALLELDKNAM